MQEDRSTDNNERRRKQRRRQTRSCFIFYLQEREREKTPCMMKCSTEVDLGFHVFCFVSVLWSSYVPNLYFAGHQSSRLFHTKPDAGRVQWCVSVIRWIPTHLSVAVFHLSTSLSFFFSSLPILQSWSCLRTHMRMCTHKHTRITFIA